MNLSIKNWLCICVWIKVIIVQLKNLLAGYFLLLITGTLFWMRGWYVDVLNCKKVDIITKIIPKTQKSATQPKYCQQYSFQLTSSNTLTWYINRGFEGSYPMLMKLFFLTLGSYSMMFSVKWPKERKKHSYVNLLNSLGNVKYKISNFKVVSPTQNILLLQRIEGDWLSVK